MQGTVRQLDGVVIGLLALAAVLLLSRLDNGLLWQDEAETAVLAQRILRYGYPRSVDGPNALEIPPPYTYGPGEAWTYNAWAPLYVSAGVFALLGASTWTARLPFALFGLLAVYLAWRLAVHLTDDRRIQRFTVALLATSVPFLLHMRQCRYYAMTTVGLLAVSLAYLRLLERPSSRRVVVWLGGWLTLLFYTNFGTFIPTAGAILVHQLVSGDRRLWRPLAVMACGVAVLILPWVAVARPGAFVGVPSLERAVNHLTYYVRITNKYLAPLAFMAGSTLLFLAAGTPSGRLGPHRVTRAAVFLVLLVGLHVLFLLLPDQRHMRYLIPVLPVLLTGVAWWLSLCLRRCPTVGWWVAGLVVFTSLLQSTIPRILLAEFAYELTHAYTGPMEGVIGYLRQHGRSGEIVKIPYDDRTVMFYTPLIVERPSRFVEETYPEWVVIRRGWVPEGFLESPYFERIQAAYDRIELDAPDILWQNREDPGPHHFRTVRDAPRVVIYRRRAASDVAASAQSGSG